MTPIDTSEFGGSDGFIEKYQRVGVHDDVLDHEMFSDVGATMCLMLDI